MRMAMNLTQGAIERMVSENDIEFDNEFKPVLQVIYLKTHCLGLSDGTHYYDGVLSPKFEAFVRSGTLQKGSVVKLTHFLVFQENQNQNHNLIAILDLDVLLDTCDVIGEPVLLPENAPLSLNVAHLQFSDLCKEISRVNRTLLSKPRMPIHLTQGAISIMNSPNFSCAQVEFKPVLQVIHVKNSRIYLSDGIHYTVGILFNDFKSRMTYPIVKPTYLANCALKNNLKIIVIIGLDFLREYCNPIGEPRPLLENAPSPPNVFDLRFGCWPPSLDWAEERIPVNLTQGAIERMSTQDFSCDNEEFQPELQVIYLENSRIWLSDGTHYNVGLLFKNLDESPFSKRLQIGSTVKLTHFGICVGVNYKIIIIIDLDVLRMECELIGKPVTLDKNAPSPPPMF